MHAIALLVFFLLVVVLLWSPIAYNKNYIIQDIQKKIKNFIRCVGEAEDLQPAYLIHYLYPNKSYNIGKSQVIIEQTLCATLHLF